MSTVEHDFLTEDLHPIDIVEGLAEHHDWEFDRVADDQIAMAIEGAWRTYSLTLAWNAADDTLRMVCAFDMDPPADRREVLSSAMERANDRLWTGAFVLWPEQKLMVFRYGLICAGGVSPTAEQIAQMVQTAVTACERFFPAFQLVSWGGETPEAAMGVALARAWGRA